MVSLIVSLLVGSHGKLCGAVLVEAEPLRCPCLLAFHCRRHGLPVWHRLRYNGNTSTRGNDQSRACDKSHPLEKESLVSSPDISGIINDSLYSEKTLFVLSAESGKGRSQVQDMLLKTWQGAKTSTTPHVRDLSLVRVSFPWSEHPAHMLYTSLMEVRDITEWETIVGNALHNQRNRDITTNLTLTHKS